RCHSKCLFIPWTARFVILLESSACNARWFGQTSRPFSQNIFAMPSTELMTELLEAGVHFGHQTKRWNPKMKPYIFEQRNGIYIINLEKSVRQLERATEFLQSLSKRGGKVLFVGTKKQAQEAIKE